MSNMSDERTLRFVENCFGGRERVEGEELGADEEFRVTNEEREESSRVESDVSSPNKRIREMAIDRLSALPDCLLTHILKFLSLKEAAITSLLSKRWQYLWTDLPGLSFEESSCFEEEVRKFVTLVHRTLLLRRVHCLNTFSVDFVCDNCFASDVNVWVEFALRSKVKHLILRLKSSVDFYTLPQRIYSNASLTWLSINGCIVAPRSTIEWQCLTSLYITGVELHQSVVEKILSGCPVLQSLDIRDCWGFKRLEVSSRSLRGLEVSDREDDKIEPLLEISAPHIHYIYIWICSIRRKRLRLTNIPSLVRANIYFGVADSSVGATDNMKELLESIQHVKELEMGCQCMAVLSTMTINGWKLPQYVLRSLTLETWRDEDSVSGVLGLLESSPNLETLVIDSCGSYEESVRTWNPPARTDLDCDLLNVKTIELSDYADPNLGGEPMLTMARILLKRATALEKMVIDVEVVLSSTFSSDIIGISQKLLSYPKSSQKAVIVFRPVVDNAIV